MAKLTDKFSSKYFESRYALNKREGKVIEVFVENEDDVPFWKHIFNQHNLNTKINPASKTDLTRGKQAILKHINNAGEFLLLCVDSDYDYLLDGATAQSRKIKENLFVFQTYTYSIENYQCFAESLHQVVVEATLNDEQLFDYVAFMKQYSEVVYELFLYSFYYEREHQQKVIFSREDFCKTISIPNQVNIHKAGEQELDDLREAVKQKLASLPKINDTDLENIKEELSKLGVKPCNTYLFVRGHTIHDNVVLMFLKPVFNHLKKRKFDEYEGLSKPSDDVKRNEYKNQVKDLETILNSHKLYESCPLMQKIKDDITDYKRQEFSETSF